MTFYLIYENGKPIGDTMSYEDALKEMLRLKGNNPNNEYTLKERYY